MVIAIPLVIGALGMYFPLKSHFLAQIEALKPEVVEVIKTDTITAYLPIEIEKRILVKDTIAIPITDTLLRVDTLYLPREQKVYEDSSYRAIVSGVCPRLDSIEVYQKTIEITKIATQKEWRKFDYGIQGGVGLLVPINGNVNFGGYIGFGVSYHF